MVLYLAGTNYGATMRKKIVITPREKYSENFFNIVPASEFVPEWYRKSPGKYSFAKSEIDPLDRISVTSTYKKCTPFFDALTAGYMVFLTSDIEVVKKDDGQPFIQWRTTRRIITDHSDIQWEGLPCPEGYSKHVYKWHNQFNINVPKGYSLLFLNPINRFDLPFMTITGIVDCDNFKLPVHFPFFIKDSFSGIIEKGTPIAQIIPIKRDLWERKHEKYDEDESMIMPEKYFSTIKRAYKNTVWERKEYK
jgi:hypothetical protein